MRTKKNLLALGLAGLALVAGGDAWAKPAAATWEQLTSTPSSGGGFSLGTTGMVYGTAAAAGVWYYGGSVSDQSKEHMAELITTRFGLAAAPSFVSGCDTPTSLCTNATATALTGNYTFSSGSVFDYLAVHMGQGELLFYWTTPQTAFAITGLPRGMSNYRAYSSGTTTNGGPSPLTPVPEPETYAMILAGLGLMGARMRRRKPA